MAPPTGFAPMPMVSETIALLLRYGGINGRDGRVRSDNLLAPNQARFQLRYIPLVM